MIVRDEAELLPRCLDSVRGLDEIVIVDTGSTDETVAIAERAGATVVHVPWAQDFAAARNAGLAHATGDWILVLDADEVLLPGSLEGLRDAMSGPHGAYVLPLENVLDGGSIQRLNLLRLFRRHPGVRFEGRVHEQVTSSLEALGWSIGHCGARIRHDGYLKARVAERDKHSRNLSLLRAMCAETPQNAYAWYQLGKTFLAIDDVDRAGPALEEAVRLVALDPHPERLAFAPTAYLHLATVHEGATGPAGSLALLTSALERFPKAAELWLKAAACQRDLGDPEQALAAYERCLQLANDTLVSGVDTRGLTVRAATQAGDLLLAHGNLPDAIACYQLAADSAAAEAFEPWLKLAVALLQAGRRPEAIAAYETVVGREPSQHSAHLALATLYFEDLNFSGALQALEVVDSVTPGNPDVAWLLGECRRRLPAQAG